MIFALFGFSDFTLYLAYIAITCNLMYLNETGISFCRNFSNDTWLSFSDQ